MTMCINNTDTSR